MGTCKKFPLWIWTEGRVVTKLPGGPKDGCHSWLFNVASVIALETLSKVCLRVSTVGINQSMTHTSNGSRCKQVTEDGPAGHPVISKSRAYGNPGSSYLLAGGQFLLEGV